MKNNKWKTAFWILFTVFILMTGFLIYTISDMGITIANLYEEQEMIDEDLKKLSGVVEGKLAREDFNDVDSPGGTTTTKFTMLLISFSEDNKIKEVKASW